MSKKKDKNGKKNLLQKYNGAGAKKDVKITGMKTGVDLVVGSGVGTGLGALLGLWSPVAGLIMIGAGHYFGDKSGVLRVAGAATIAYGIAKAVENRAASEESAVNGITMSGVADGAKRRLIDFKNNWLKATYADKLFSKKSEESEQEEDGETTVGAIDLRALDVFEDMTKQSAIQHELKQLQQEDDLEEEDFLIEDDLEGLNYAIIEEEEIDFSTL